MNLALFLVCVLSHWLFWAPSAYGWDSDDHEIFDLVSALEASEGKSVTFYTFLNITKTATLSEINKAARKRSLELHPDKNPNVKNIEARFARLGVITAILRDDEKRERYNFFHDNGVPKWKGTGYMYSRWQPGLGFALLFILSVATLMQYGVQHVNYRSELTRIKKFQIAAKQAAYGPPPSRGTQTSSNNNEKSTSNNNSDKEDVNSSKQLIRKKVKISINKSLAIGEDGIIGDNETLEIQGPRTRQERRRQKQFGGGNNNSNNGVGQVDLIEMVVEGNNVWIVAEDGTELPLNESAATAPSFKNTFIPVIFQRLMAPFLPKSTSPQSIDESVVKTEDNQLDPESDGTSKLTGNGTENGNKSGVVRKRKTGKAKK